MTTDQLWLSIGFLGQAFFSARFFVQWVATLLAYAIHRRDPVFIIGQAAGLLVYARNLYFIFRTPHTGVS